MKRNSKPSNYLDFLTHIDYEVDQLAAFLPELFRDPAPYPPRMKNALLEDALLHARCLIGFLVGSKRDDDIFPEDFVPGFKCTVTLPDAAEVDRMSKQVAHLTYKRYAGSDSRKQWGAATFIDVLRGMEEFYSALKRPLPATARALLQPPITTPQASLMTIATGSVMTATVPVVGTPIK